MVWKGIRVENHNDKGIKGVIGMSSVGWLLCLAGHALHLVRRACLLLELHFGSFSWLRDSALCAHVCWESRGTTGEYQAGVIGE